ncbi:MAG TPA: hypothetical protein VFM97_06470 [Gammaproteobacteria bacterium]|nr:hypothetical protein [Gammaproteobacteria bacterium]
MMRYVVFAEEKQKTFRMSPEFDNRGEAEDYMESLTDSFAGNPRFYIVDLPPHAKLMNRGFIKPAVPAPGVSAAAI